MTTITIQEDVNIIKKEFQNIEDFLEVLLESPLPDLTMQEIKEGNDALLEFKKNPQSFYRVTE